MIANADVKVPPLSRPGQGGDRPGFEEQALPYLRELYPAAVRLTRSRCEAEDLVQETFTRAYAKFSQYQQGTNLRAWLYRIMFSTFCSTRRKQASRPSETLTADAPGLASKAASLPMARSAETQALENLAASPAMRALGELPDAFKTVVYLADVHGYHYAEIAELMGTPVGTVMSRIYRGRRMLRARLTGTAAARARTADTRAGGRVPDAADASRRADASHARAAARGADAGGPPSPRAGQPAAVRHLHALPAPADDRGLPAGDEPLAA